MPFPSLDIGHRLPVGPYFKKIAWNRPRKMYRRIGWSLIFDEFGTVVTTGLVFNKIDFKVPHELKKIIGVWGTLEQSLPTGDFGDAGYLTLHINGKRSNPIQVPITRKTATSMKRKWDVYSLNEPVIAGTHIQAEYKQNVASIGDRLRIYIKGLYEYPIN